MMGMQQTHGQFEIKHRPGDQRGQSPCQHGGAKRFHPGCATPNCTVSGVDRDKSGAHQCRQFGKRESTDDRLAISENEVANTEYSGDKRYTDE